MPKITIQAPCTIGKMAHARTLLATLKSGDQIIEARIIVPVPDRLSDIGNVGSTHGVAKLMTCTKEEMQAAEAASLVWARQVGSILAGMQICGAGGDEAAKALLTVALGRLLDGTSARAEWDLRGTQQGMFEALRILPVGMAEIQVETKKGYDETVKAFQEAMKAGGAA